MTGRITVLAGVNGAGKSSIAGEALREKGASYYNPDEVTARLRAEGLPEEDANSRAWHEGRRLLERAITEDLDFALETTLGASTIPGLLREAARRGMAVRVWFVGLSSPELHFQRVQARVARGGHDIPEETIRRRWTTSRENLIRLLPHLAELSLWDNSEAAAVHEGERARPRKLLAMRDGRVIERCPLEDVPSWAKPIVAAALAGERGRGGG